MIAITRVRILMFGLILREIKHKKRIKERQTSFKRSMGNLRELISTEEYLYRFVSNLKYYLFYEKSTFQLAFVAIFILSNVNSTYLIVCQ